MNAEHPYRHVLPNLEATGKDFRNIHRINALACRQSWSSDVYAELWIWFKHMVLQATPGHVTDIFQPPLFFRLVLKPRFARSLSIFMHSHLHTH